MCDEISHFRESENKIAVHKNTIPYGTLGRGIESIYYFYAKP